MGKAKRTHQKGHILTFMLHIETVLLYYLLYELQRTQTLADKTGSYLPTWQRISFKGVPEWSPVSSANAQYRTEKRNGECDNEATWFEIGVPLCGIIQWS